MAYISDYNTEYFLSNTASITPSMPTHVSGDLILFCLTQDTGTTAIATATSGWSMIGTQAASGASRQAWAYKIAASSSEPAPTFTGTNDDWISQYHVIKDADPTTPIHVNARSNWNNVQTVSSPSATSTNDDCLVLYSWGSDGTNKMTVNPSDLICTTKDTGTGVTSIVGYRNHLTAGATSTVTMNHEIATEGGNAWVLIINNKSGGAIGPDMRGALELVRRYGIYDQGFTDAPNSVSGLTAINSINMHSSTATISSGVITSSFSPWGNLTQLSVNETTLGWGGAFDTFPASVDVTDKSFLLSFEISTSTSNLRYGAQGIICVFVDSSNNWVAHRLFTFNELAVNMFSFCIQPNQGSTVYDSSASPIDISTISKFGIFVHRTAATNSSALIRVKNLMMTGTSIAINGSESSPINVKSLTQAYTNWDIFEASKLQGLGQFLNKQSIQIGNGTTPTYVDFGATSYEIAVPSKFFGVPNYISNFVICASALDTINLASSIIATSQMNSFIIDAASSLAATYDFSGASIVGWDVTWLTGVDAIGVNFVRCGEVDGKAASFTSCSFKNGIATNLLRLEDEASLDSCSFIKGDSATYAIEIDTAGDFIFNNTTFSGFTTDINVTAATGTVSITLSSGDYTPTYTTAGATVILLAPTVDITATVVAGSRVQVYNVTTSTEIDNVIEAGTSYSYTVTSEASDGDIIRIRVTKLGLESFEGQTLFNAAGGASFFVLQPSDDVYIINAIDGSTVTEFVEDYPNVQVDIDDPDGVTNVSRLYAWYSYVLTTSTGIEDWFGGLLAEDVANYKIITSILDLKLDNIASTGVIFNGGKRLYRDDGDIPVVMSTTGGGSIVLYADKVYTVETGTSGLTTGEAATLAKLDTLTENVSGLRFTTKALETAGGSSLTVGDIADAVWDEAISGHLTAGTTGAALNGASAPSAATVASAVRTELTTELGRIDVATSTRLSTAGYTTPPSVSAIRTEIDTNSTKLDVAVSTRLSTVDYTAPDNASITAIKAKTDNLPTDPADNSDILAAISAIPSAPSSTTIASAVRTELTTELGRIDVATSTRLSTAGYTAPANADIVAIKAKTDNLPTDPADNSEILAAIAAIPTPPTSTDVADAVRIELTTELGRIDVATSTRLDSASYIAPDNSGVAAIKAKTDNLPTDPASETSVNALPTLVEIEASTEIAKESTSQEIKGKTKLIPAAL